MSDLQNRDMDMVLLSILVDALRPRPNMQKGNLLKFPQEHEKRFNAAG